MPDTNAVKAPRVIPLYENAAAANTALAGKRVSVYWNIRKKVYSILDHSTRRVIAHSKGLVLSAPRFKVNSNGRARVIKSRQKNVHAFIDGIVEPYSTVKQNFKVQYTPYINDSFVYYNGKQFRPIHSAYKAELLVSNNHASVSVDEIRVG